LEEGPEEKKEEEAIMTTVRLSFAALNFDSADPAVLAEFWGNVLGRPFGPGALAGDMAVDATDPASGPRLVLHPAGDVPKTIKNGLRPILLTDRHDEEIKRLTGLGATVVTPSTQPPGVRVTTFSDPEGNEFDLVTFQPK
jgi:predicted enzyme related to lactoylglutathione lyase